ISRVADMGIEPYLLRSGLLGILSLRLLRRLCACRQAASATQETLGLPVDACWVPAGCERCRQSGYVGRLLLAELLRPEMGGVGAAILQRTDTADIQRHAVAAGMCTLYKR